MLNKDKRNFLKKNIGRMEIDEIAKTIHARPDEIREEIKRMNLSPKRESVAPAAPHVSLPLNKMFAVIILAVLVIGVYANSLSGEFVWDDQTIVVRNDAIKSFGNIPYVLTNQFAEMAKYRGNIYRPMQEISYMADHLLWGMNAFGFHVTSVLLQLTATLLLFYVVLNISGSATVAFIASAIFGIHPINTEAIAYISGRSDPLYLVFLLASFLFYIGSRRHEGRRSAGYYTCAVGLYVFSLMSRETAIVFPLILAAYEQFAAKTKADWRKVLPFAAVVACYAVLRIGFIPLDQKRVAFLGIDRIAFIDIKVMAEYLKMLLLPAGLHMEREIRHLLRVDMLFIAGLAAVIAFTAIFFRTWKARRAVFFWVLWFIIFLLPHLNVVTLNASYAEHWIYAAAIGLYVIFADFLEEIMAKGRISRMAGYAILAGLLVYLGGLGILRNRDWRDEPSIYSNTLKYKNSARVASNLGVYYDIRGEYEKAIDSYRRALAVSPNEPLYHNNIAIVYVKAGDTAKAVEHWKQSLSINPDQPQVREFLAQYSNK